MPQGLKRYQQSGDLHFITFSCYRRAPLLQTSQACTYQTLAFWQRRYYDFNVWTAKKRIQKLRYMHRNPVKRGLVEKPEDWMWSSFRHYATGVEG